MDPQQHDAYPAIMRYCSYQDRSEKEVLAKLQKLEVPASILDPMLKQLKADRFLDERRYVESFVRGRFVGKQWGKRKIKLALATKGIASILIDEALAAIADEDYIETLKGLALRKRQTLVADEGMQRKLVHYLIQKGYESDLVYTIVKELIKA